MGYYPIFLDLSGRRCAVIGGGAVAERKVEGLIECGADVTVISPDLTDLIASRAREGKIGHIPRRYTAGDLQGYHLAFVATDDPGTNAAVFREGKSLGVWVNAADDRDRCDFILPSVVRRGHLMVAVATGGRSPALSRAIREELEAYFTTDYEALAEIVAEVRSALAERSQTPDPEAWRSALNGRFRQLIKDGRRREAKAYLVERLGRRCG